MSLNKPPSIEYPTQEMRADQYTYCSYINTQGKSGNCQEQFAPRHDTVSGASSRAALGDEKYHEYTSEQMREAENGVHEEKRKLKKYVDKYISAQIKKIEIGRHEEMKKLKKDMDEYISEQMEKIENGRHEEIKKLMKRVEEYISEQMEKIEKKEHQHIKDQMSPALRSKTKQVSHGVVDRSLSNQQEMTIGNLTLEGHCYDGSTKTTYASENVKTTSEYMVTNKGHPAMEVDGKSANRPSTRQDAVRVGSEISAQAFRDYRIQTQADSPKNSSVSGHTPLNSSHLSMEVIEENTLESNSPRRLCVLLLGSSGNGKSSIGNSILGKDVFRTSSSGKSPTPCIAMDNAQMGDQTVQVVDGPSIRDSKDADEDFIEQIVVSMETSLTLCDYAFSAIVIVLRFGARFTKQEVNTIKLIKSVLGENVIKDYGICAVSCGDNFEHSVEEAREDGQLLTFEGWCREQTGEVKTLFEECNFRCVLFNNRTKDENTKNAQRLAFLKMVSPMKPYSKEEFLKAQTSLKKIIDSERMIHDLEEQTQTIIDNTRSAIQDLSEDSSLQHMNSLLKHLTDHQGSLRELGMSSPKLRELAISMQLLETEIRSKMGKKSLLKDNISLTPPLFKSYSSPTHLHSTLPTSTQDCCEQGLFFDENASGMVTGSRNMGYTQSIDDWYFVQGNYYPFPPVHGYREVTPSDWVTRKLAYIWKNLKQYATKIYPH